MRVIISAAGTAGHINPGIAIANKIKEKEPNSEIVFIGTNRGLENDLVSRAGYKLKIIEAYGFKKEISIKNIKNILSTYKSRKNVEEIIKEFKPDIVIGTGGYICVPVFIAALKLKIPTVLHESNAYPGKAVKMFAKKVDCVFLGFEDAKEKLENSENIIVTGNPTKFKKININESKKNEIYKNLGIKSKLPMILVFGGSQGAQKINEAFVELIEKENIENYQIVWATGQNQFDYVKELFEKSNISINNIKNVKILPYIYNMEEMMNTADLIVCRSGAMTITELAICEKPAIFIPLPSRSANRQVDNAKVFEKKGAAKIILNDELNGEILSKNINEMIKRDLKEMGEKVKNIVVDNVEEKIYSEIKKIVDNNIEKSI